MMRMTPAAVRAAILVAELMVFFIVTAFMTYFISHAGALVLSPGDAPPAQFPVIAYDGDRKQPEPKHYLVVPWSEWESVAAKRPGASLLLPERAARIRIGETEATFTASNESESRQNVELTWRSSSSEQHVRYVAQARAISPAYYRAVSTHTLLVGAAIGFVAGLFAGRAMRRRWMTQPGYLAPPTQNN
jgi:hypothetical protein